MVFFKTNRQKHRFLTICFSGDLPSSTCQKRTLWVSKNILRPGWAHLDWFCWHKESFGGNMISCSILYDVRLKYHITERSIGSNKNVPISNFMPQTLIYFCFWWNITYNYTGAKLTATKCLNVKKYCFSHAIYCWRDFSSFAVTKWH